MARTGRRADSASMNKKVLWMCMAVGSTVGGYLPTLVGQGSFSLASIVGSALGAVAGVFAAQRIDADF
jgi:outer membrane lipoprotein SlyB